MPKIDELSSRPPTHIYTTRVDVRYLATLIRYWRKEGSIPKSNSELLRLSIESFAELLVLNNKIDFVENFDDAFEIVGATGHAGKLQPQVAARALKDQGVSLESIPFHIDSGHRRSKEKNPVSSIELRAASEKLNEALEQKMAEKDKEQTEELKANMGAKPNARRKKK